MKSKPKIPSNLGVKIGSKLEAFWTQVRDAAKEALTTAEHSALLQRDVLKIAEHRIREEHDKFKKA